MLYAFKNSRLFHPRISSALLQKGMTTRLFSVSFDSTKIAETIVNNYHPSDTKVCLKTLKTLGSLRSKETAKSALSSVSFRSKNERKVFLTWLQSVVSNVNGIPPFPTVKKLTSRKKKTSNLLDSCRAYLMVRDKDDRDIDLNDIEALILDIADNIPERLVFDVSAMLRKYTFDLQEEKALESRTRAAGAGAAATSTATASLTDVFLQDLVSMSSIYFDVLLSLVLALDIVENKGRQYAALRSQAAKLQKQRINDTSSFSVFLERVVANIEAWQLAKSKALLENNINNNSNNSSEKKGTDIHTENDNADIHHDHNDHHGGRYNSDGDGNKISRVKHMSSHQWGWSLHCLRVSVSTKQASPLEQWLLDEEARMLSPPSPESPSPESASPESASTSASAAHSHSHSDSLSRSNAASLPVPATSAPGLSLCTLDTDRVMDDTEPRSRGGEGGGGGGGRSAGQRDSMTTFVTPDDDDEHTSADFDEPYRFQDIYTLVAETRDQNSLEDIATDNDMSEKLKYSTGQYKVLIDSLPPLITDQELTAAFDRAGGGVKFLQVFHPDRFEASQPCQHATILNKKMKRRTQMKQIIHSDTYAFVAFDSKETYDTLTKGDMRLFGMCIMHGYRSHIRPAQSFDTFYLETLTRKPTKYWVDLVSSILGHDHEMTYGSAYRSENPAFIQFKFRSHEDAWKAFLLLELALVDGGHHFQLNWRKCTWFYAVQTRSREKRRNNLAYLTKIADKINPPEIEAVSKTDRETRKQTETDREIEEEEQQQQEQEQEQDPFDFEYLSSDYVSTS